MISDLLKYFVNFVSFILNLELIPGISIYQLLIFALIVTVIVLAIKALFVNK